MTATGQYEDYFLTPFTPGTAPWVPDETSPLIRSTLELVDFSGNNIRRNDPNNCAGCN